MNKLTIKGTLVLSLLALAACGGDSVTGPEETDDTVEDRVGEGAIEDTASEIVTTLADVNGFQISTTTLNPHAYDINGTDVEITAFVKDHSNNPVKDGTVVSFVADDNGLIEDQCATTNGTCTVTWTSARDRSQPVDPDAGGDAGYINDFKITIMARTIGEDSFIDKNANSQFDADETYFTQSEAFLDANDDGDYDANTEFDEYFDFNNNGQFDADGSLLFRGNSCSDGARALGHCATRLEVWDTLRMINSSGDAVYMSLSDCAGNVIAENLPSAQSTGTITLTAATTYCLEVTDPNGNVPPSGSKISVSTDNGQIDVAPDEVPNTYIEPGNGYVGGIRIKPDDTSSIGGTMTIETESLDGQKEQLYVTVND